MGLSLPLQRQQAAAAAAAAGGGGSVMGGSVGSSASSAAGAGQNPRLEISHACKDFLRWMRIEDDGARVSNSTAYAYHLILTELLRAAGCELSRLKGPEDLKRYVLNHREEIEELVPPNRAPYPKERGAWKKVWEWASGERIWEEEGGHHLAGGGFFYYRGNGVKTQVRGKVAAKGEGGEEEGEEGEEGMEGMEGEEEEEEEQRGLMDEEEEEEEEGEEGELQGDEEREENEEEEEGEGEEEERTAAWRGSKRLAAKRARIGTEARAGEGEEGEEEGGKEGGKGSGSGAAGVVPKHWLLMDPISSLLGGGGGKEKATGKKQASL